MCLSLNTCIFFLSVYRSSSLLQHMAPSYNLSILPSFSTPPMFLLPQFASAHVSLKTFHPLLLSITMSLLPSAPSTFLSLPLPLSYHMLSLHCSSFCLFPFYQSILFPSLTLRLVNPPLVSFCIHSIPRTFTLSAFLTAWG